MFAFLGVHEHHGVLSVVSLKVTLLGYARELGRTVVLIVLAVGHLAKVLWVKREIRKGDLQVSRQALLWTWLISSFASKYALGRSEFD